MSAQSALQAGRSTAERLMIDEGKALRPTGNTVYNPGTQQDEDQYDDLFGPVKCKVKPPRTVAPRDVEVGGRTAAIIPGEVHLPANTDYAGLTIGDVWEVTATASVSLSQVGRRYRITGEADGSLLTACRYTIERVVS